MTPTRLLNPGGVETGMISIDAFEILEFGNKVNVTIDGRAGDDDVNVSDPSNPGASGDLTIIGDDPTASDAVVINGTSGSDTVEIEITGPHSAIVTINSVDVTNVNTTEGLIFNGNGGDDDIVILGISTGDNHFVYAPGAVPDAASFTGFDADSFVPFLPVDLFELGDGTITVDGNSDYMTTLVVLGKDTNDTIDIDSFAIDHDIAVTTLAGVHNPIFTERIRNLNVDGLNGDDVFAVAGDHEYDAIAIDGNNPSASDVLNFNGSGGAIEVDYAASTVSEFGFNDVTFTGIETLNADAGSANLTVQGTVYDDSFDVTPDETIPLIGTATVTRLANSNTTVNAINVDVFTIDGISGDDTLTVNGSATDNNTIDVTGNYVEIVSPARQRVDYQNIDALNVLGSTGDDVFDVTTDEFVEMFIDGGQSDRRKR